MSAPKRPAPARVEVTLDERGDQHVQVSAPWFESFRVRARPKRLGSECQMWHTSAMDRAFVLLGGEIKTPPMSDEARRAAGVLLRALQRGESLSLPHSRPMPVIGPRCHELRIQDANRTWRIMYRVDPNAIVVAEVFAKTTRATPAHVIELCKRRLRDWDRRDG
jgi:phage-related protein